MGKINNYSVESVNPGDRVLCSDASTGETKNVTAQSISNLASSSVVYRAYLTQSGTSAPVATVLDGSTITGTWAYIETGRYSFTPSVSLLDKKVAIIFSINVNTGIEVCLDDRDDVKAIIATYANGTLSNALILDQYVEILIHTI
jgi:hypothetical protein